MWAKLCHKAYSFVIYNEWKNIMFYMYLYVRTRTHMYACVCYTYIFAMECCLDIVTLLRAFIVMQSHLLWNSPVTSDKGLNVFAKRLSRLGRLSDQRLLSKLGATAK